MIDQMLFFRGTWGEKAAEDAASWNENKTAGRAFLRSVAFLDNYGNKITPTFSFLYSFSISHFHVIFFDLIIFFFIYWLRAHPTNPFDLFILSLSFFPQPGDHNYARNYAHMDYYCRLLSSGIYWHPESGRHHLHILAAICCHSALSSKVKRKAQ